MLSTQKKHPIQQPSAVYICVMIKSKWLKVSSLKNRTTQSIYHQRNHHNNPCNRLTDDNAPVADDRCEKECNNYFCKQFQQT